MMEKLARGSRPMLLAPLLAVFGALVVTSAHGQITDATRRAAWAAVPPSTTTMPAAAAPESSGSGVIRMEKVFDGPELSIAPAKLPIAPAEAPAAVTQQGPAATPQTAQRQGDVIFVPAPPVQTWEVQIADVNLSNTFQRWAGVAGYRVKWDANRHILIDAPGEIRGSFEDALERVLASSGIRNSDYPLEVCFYPNTPPLARITRRGEQVKDCK